MDGIEPGLESTRYFKMPNVYHQPETQGRFSTYPSWPNGASACIVEVDPETGYVKILATPSSTTPARSSIRCSPRRNLHGGITQGIGGAMYEKIVYDEAGQPLTTTFMDYTIPTAVECHGLRASAHQETPSPFTPLGTKGVGESGVTGPLGSLCSAIENAFPELDLNLSELPLTPQTVWKAIHQAKRREQ